jgi:hypothetical protein
LAGAAIAAAIAKAQNINTVVTANRIVPRMSVFPLRPKRTIAQNGLEIYRKNVRLVDGKILLPS